MRLLSFLVLGFAWLLCRLLFFVMDWFVLPLLRLLRAIAPALDKYLLLPCKRLWRALRRPGGRNQGEGRHG